ncbi:MAG: tail fiber domain-containing protein [Phycisphaerales bacterium]|nr:tail fiber domain-containing protein [Planctomycetota bacterium]
MKLALGAIWCLILSVSAWAAPGVSTAFTFAGSLEQSKGDLSGPTSMSFTLWDSIVEGNQLGQTLTFDGSDGNGSPITIAESGRFIVGLDFGVPVWGTQARYIEVTADGQLQQPRFIISGSTFSANTRGINVQPNGNVGIGTSNPGNFLLAVNGPTANRTGSWSVLSDARLKKDIRELEPGTLDRLLMLRGVEFEYTDEAKRDRNVASGLMVGFLAQDVECIFPEWVDRDEAGIRFVTERGTTALLVEALRELRREKDDQIAVLEAQHKAEMERLAREKDAKMREIELRLERLEKTGSSDAEMKPQK